MVPPIVFKAIKEADLIIYVLDARSIDDTLDMRILEKIESLEKKLLFAVTKCDLHKTFFRRKPAVFISGKTRNGVTMLKKKLISLSKGKTLKVAIVGVPNVGKSTLINALAGRHKARTSSERGFTKGIQFIRIHKNIMLLDTPGAFLRKRKVDDIVPFLQKNKNYIKEKLKLSSVDASDILEELAERWHLKQSGGGYNLNTAAAKLFNLWDKGEI